MFNAYRLSRREDGEVLEMDGDGGCTTMGMYLIPLTCTLKNA